MSEEGGEEEREMRTEVLQRISEMLELFFQTSEDFPKTSEIILKMSEFWGCYSDVFGVQVGEVIINKSEEWTATQGRRRHAQEGTTA